HFHGLRARRLGHPDVTLAVNMEPVRPDEHPTAEAFDDLALGIELEDAIDVLELVVRAEAIDSKAATGGQRYGTGLVAADHGPEAFPVDIDIDGCGRSGWSTGPLGSGNEGAASVGESFHGAVGIGYSGLGEGVGSNGEQRHNDRRRHHSDAIY